MSNYESQEHYEYEIGAAGAAEAEAEYHEHMQGLLNAGEYDLWALEMCASKLDNTYPYAALQLRDERNAIIEARKPKPEQPHEDAP